MREAGVLLALIALCVGMSFASPYFFTLRNIFNVLQGMSTIGIMAVGMTMVLIAGGLDLSVGSVLAVGAVLTARLMTYSGAQSVAVGRGGLAAGVAIGRERRALDAREDRSFHRDLGTLSIARGLAFLLATRGSGSVATTCRCAMRRRVPGAGYVGPVPVPVLLMFTSSPWPPYSSGTRSSAADLRDRQ